MNKNDKVKTALLELLIMLIADFFANIFLTFISSFSIAVVFEIFLKMKEFNGYPIFNIAFVVIFVIKVLKTKLEIRNTKGKE